MQQAWRVPAGKQKRCQDRQVQHHHHSQHDCQPKQDPQEPLVGVGDIGAHRIVLDFGNSADCCGPCHIGRASCRETCAGDHKAFTRQHTRKSPVGGAVVISAVGVLYRQRETVSFEFLSQTELCLIHASTASSSLRNEQSTLIPLAVMLAHLAAEVTLALRQHAQQTRSKRGSRVCDKKRSAMLKDSVQCHVNTPSGSSTCEQQFSMHVMLIPAASGEANGNGGHLTCQPSSRAACQSKLLPLHKNSPHSIRSDSRNPTRCMPRQNQHHNFAP